MHVAAVLTLTHLYNTLQSVVTGQAPITVERKISSGGNQIKQKIIKIFYLSFPTFVPSGSTSPLRRVSVSLCDCLVDSIV